MMLDLTNNTADNRTYVFQAFLDFNNWYKSIHGYASLVVCLFGITLNFFNVIVLTRKHMISSTNILLTALAISDFLTMLVYIPASLKFYCLVDKFNADSTKCTEVDAIMHTYFWTFYALFYINITVTMHSFSIWLTVLLAFFRYLYICQNKIGQRVCTKKNTIISIFLTFLFCVVLCIPSFLLSKIVPVSTDRIHSNFTNPNQTFYELAQSEIDLKLNGLIFSLTFIIQAFLTKFIPCVLLIVLSSLLIYSIHRANKSSKRLQSLGRKTKESEKSREHTRTNIMLVMVCVIFFLTEFPQGIMAILSFILESTNFHTQVYMKLGDIMDILSLINNAINFILYCLMSRTFRHTFKDILYKAFCFLRQRPVTTKNGGLGGRLAPDKQNFNLKFANYQSTCKNDASTKSKSNDFRMLNVNGPSSSSSIFFKIKDAINKDSSNYALYSNYDLKANYFRTEFDRDYDLDNDRSGLLYIDEEYTDL
jgi:hypothetical protein